MTSEDKKLVLICEGTANGAVAVEHCFSECHFGHCN